MSNEWFAANSRLSFVICILFSFVQMELINTNRKQKGEKMKSKGKQVTSLPMNIGSQETKLDSNVAHLNLPLFLAQQAYVMISHKLNPRSWSSQHTST